MKLSNLGVVLCRTVKIKHCFKLSIRYERCKVIAKLTEIMRHRRREGNYGFKTNARTGSIATSSL